MRSPRTPTAIRSTTFDSAAPPAPGERGWRIETERETRFLDEDGDGRLDGVLVREALVAVRPGARTVLTRRSVVLHGVDDAGRARSCSVVDR